MSKFVIFTLSSLLNYVGAQLSCPPIKEYIENSEFSHFFEHIILLDPSASGIVTPHNGILELQCGDGFTSVNMDSSHSVGDSVSFAGQTSVIECLNGKWQAPPIKCMAPCEGLAPWMHSGFEIFGHSFIHGSSRQVGCRRGFFPTIPLTDATEVTSSQYYNNAKSNRKSTPAVKYLTEKVTCVNGSWSPPSFNCVPMCGRRPNFDSKVYNIKYMNEDETIIKITCQPGYTPQHRFSVDELTSSADEGVREEDSFVVLSCKNGQWPTNMSLRCLKQCDIPDFTTLLKSVDHFEWSLLPRLNLLSEDANSISSASESKKISTSSNSNATATSQDFLTGSDWTSNPPKAFFSSPKVDDGTSIAFRCRTSAHVSSLSGANRDSIVCRDGNWTPLTLQCVRSCASYQSTDSRFVVRRASYNNLASFAPHGSHVSLSCASAHLPAAYRSSKVGLAQNEYMTVPDFVKSERARQAVGADPSSSSSVEHNGEGGENPKDRLHSEEIDESAFSLEDGSTTFQFPVGYHKKNLAIATFNYTVHGDLDKFDNPYIGGPGGDPGAIRDLITGLPISLSTAALSEITCIDGEWTSPKLICLPACPVIPDLIGLKGKAKLSSGVLLVTHDEDSWASRLLVPSGSFAVPVCPPDTSLMHASIRGPQFADHDVKSISASIDDPFEAPSANAPPAMHLFPSAATKKTQDLLTKMKNRGESPCVSGSWGSSRIRCVPNCPKFTLSEMDGSHGLMVEGSMSENQIGAYRIVSCRPGFYPALPLQRTVRERVNCIEGAWEIPKLRCYPSCSPLKDHLPSGSTAAASSQHVLTEATQHGAIAKLACDLSMGYLPAPNNPINVAMARCLNGVWVIKNPLICEPSCSAHPPSSPHLRLVAEVSSLEDLLLVTSYKASSSEDAALNNNTALLQLSLKIMRQSPAKHAASNTTSDLSSVAGDASPFASSGTKALLRCGPASSAVPLQTNFPSSLSFGNASSNSVDDLSRLNGERNFWSVWQDVMLRSNAVGENSGPDDTPDDDWYLSKRGADISTCIGGRWTETTLSCMRDCEPYAYQGRGYLIDRGDLSSFDRVRHGSNVHVSCSAGFTADEPFGNAKSRVAVQFANSIPDARETLTCYDGEWQRRTIQCFANCRPFADEFLSVSPGFASKIRVRWAADIQTSRIDSLVGDYGRVHNFDGRGVSTVADEFSNWFSGAAISSQAVLPPRAHGSILHVECVSPFAHVNTAYNSDQVTCRDGLWSPLVIGCVSSCHPLRASDLSAFGLTSHINSYIYPNVTSSSSENSLGSQLEDSLEIDGASVDATISYKSEVQVQGTQTTSDKYTPQVAPISDGRDSTSRSSIQHASAHITFCEPGTKIRVTHLPGYTYSSTGSPPTNTNFGISNVIQNPGTLPEDLNKLEDDKLVCYDGKWTDPVVKCENVCKAPTSSIGHVFTIVSDASGWSLENSLQREQDLLLQQSEIQIALAASTSDPESPIGKYEQQTAQVALDEITRALDGERTLRNMDSISNHIHPTVHVTCPQNLMPFPMFAFPEGGEDITCVDGIWSPITLLCKKPCPPAPTDLFSIMDGVAISEDSPNIYQAPEDDSSTDGFVSHGYRLTFSCAAGYGPVGRYPDSTAMRLMRPDNEDFRRDDSGALTCVDGVWKLRDLRCEKQCRPIENDDSLDINDHGSSSTSPGSVKTLTCKTGFFPVSWDRAHANEIVRCVNGRWSPTPSMRCVPGCNAFSVPDKGNEYRYVIQRLVGGGLVNAEPERVPWRFGSETSDGESAHAVRMQENLVASMVPHGGARQVSCASGYVPSRGFNHEMVLCRNGIWTSPTLRCVPRIFTEWTSDYIKIWDSLSHTISAESRTTKKEETQTEGEDGEKQTQSSSGSYSTYDSQNPQPRVTIWRPVATRGFVPVSDVVVEGANAPQFASMLLANADRPIGTSNAFQMDSANVEMYWGLRAYRRFSTSGQCAGIFFESVDEIANGGSDAVLNDVFGELEDSSLSQGMRAALFSACVPDACKTSVSVDTFWRGRSIQSHFHGGRDTTKSNTVLSEDTVLSFFVSDVTPYVSDVRVGSTGNQEEIWMELPAPNKCGLSCQTIPKDLGGPVQEVCGDQSFRSVV